MTPGARVQAAIECLDDIMAGAPAEQVLTAWARRSRFAGSGDRAAVRDHVFDVLRCRRSCAALGGGETGRALVLGALRAAQADLPALFAGQGYGPAALSDQEAAAGQAPTGAEAMDLPDWLWAQFREDLGDQATGVAEALRHRAAVQLRVNAARIDRAGAQTALAEDGIETRPHPASPFALEVTQDPRRLRGSRGYLDGLVELQDAGSQAVIEALGVRSGMRVLDYCAGGGGKSLALAACGAEVVAHDANANRLRDIPARATRAGARITLAETEALASMGPFDLVLCDVPCSGSGSWRRAPDAKWRLTPERLSELTRIQGDILRDAEAIAGTDGALAYVTCSVLKAENQTQVDAFVAPKNNWTVAQSTQWLPGHGTDGFFMAHLTRE